MLSTGMVSTSSGPTGGELVFDKCLHGAQDESTHRRAVVPIDDVLGESLSESDQALIEEDTPLLFNKHSRTHNADKTNGNRCYIPARFVLAFLAFTGYINTFTLRMDLNIAVLCLSHADNETTIKNMTMIQQPMLTQNQQAMALGAFYYGYCSTQILGGYLTGIFGGKWIMGLGSLVTSLVALATPVAITTNYYLLILCRVIQGLAQGLAQPCMHTLWSKWAPEKEKSKLVTIALSGCQMGNIVATLATGYMCFLSPTLKWSLIFYVFGSIGLLWSLLWLLLVHETPADHPRISVDEVEYIEKNKSHFTNKSTSKPPWIKLIFSPAFLAILTAHFANDWGCFALTTCLPLYMKHVLNEEIQENGVLSSLAFIFLLVTSPLSGILADFLISRNILSTKNTRKLLNSVGLLIPSCLMIGVCFAESSRDLTITLLTLAVGFTGFTMAGYTVNHLDIVPPFAGLLYGMSNTIGTSTGFLGPAIVSALTKHHNTAAEWRIFFFITAGIFFTGGVIFLLLAEGEPRSWVKPYMLTHGDGNLNGNTNSGNTNSKRTCSEIDPYQHDCHNNIQNEEDDGDGHK